MSLDVKGGADFRGLADQVRGAADRELNRRISAAIRRVAKPIGQKVIREGAAPLPKSGGLAARVARGKVGVRASLTGRSPSVTLQLKADGYDLTDIDRKGALRHPVFGNRRTWVLQRVRGGAFTRAFEANAPTAQRAVMRAVQETLDGMR